MEPTSLGRARSDPTTDVAPRVADPRACEIFARFGAVLLAAARILCKSRWSDLFVGEAWNVARLLSLGVRLLSLELKDEG